LIVVVFLAFDNDLLSLQDELIPTILGEVLLGQELLAAFEGAGGGISLLLRDTLINSVLENWSEMTTRRVQDST